MTIVAELHSRALRNVLAAPATTAHALRLLSVSTITRVEQQRNASNKHLSAEGQAARTREAMAKVALRYSLSKVGIERERASRKSERDALERRAFDPYRADTMGAEIRAALKGLPHGEKIRLAAEDPRILAALIVAPPIVHGVAPEALGHLVQGYLEKNHAADLKRLAAKDEALAAADASLHVATDTLYQAGGFPHARAFGDWLAATATPTAQALEAEAAGRAAPGQPVWSMMESMDVTMTDALHGLPK